MIDQASPKPVWRETPRACLPDSASDPLDGILLEHLHLFDREAHNCRQVAEGYDDLAVRASYMKLADIYLDHMLRIEAHRGKYRNFGRQQVTTAHEDKTVVHEIGPAAQPIASDQLENNNDWRKEPRKALTSVARAPADVMLLEHIDVRDREMHRCFDKIASCFVPEQHVLFAKLALRYASKILDVAAILRKQHTHGQQYIVIKREFVREQPRQMRRSARGTRNRNTVAKDSQKGVREASR
jgi:hypothetical protein